MGTVKVSNQTHTLSRYIADNMVREVVSNTANTRHIGGSHCRNVNKLRVERFDLDNT